MNHKEREERYVRGTKCFSIPYEAWYADTAVKPFEKEGIILGCYDEDGGAVGEFRLEWSEYGIQLKAYNDAWGALNRMPELLGFMAQLDLEGKEPALEEFVQMLRSLGYQDRTKREEGE